MVQDGKLKIVFIRSVNNPADGMTKNLQSALHNKHAHVIYDGMLQASIVDHQSREDVNNNDYLCPDDPQPVLQTDQGWTKVGTGKKGWNPPVHIYYFTIDVQQKTITHAEKTSDKIKLNL